MGGWKRWALPVAAAGLILAGLLALDWWTVSGDSLGVHAEIHGRLREVIGCAGGACVSADAPGHWGLIGEFLFWLGLAMAGALLLVGGLAFVHASAESVFAATARASGVLLALIVLATCDAMFEFNAMPSLAPLVTAAGALLGLVARVSTVTDDNLERAVTTSVLGRSRPAAASTSTPIAEPTAPPEGAGPAGVPPEDLAQLVAVSRAATRAAPVPRSRKQARLNAVGPVAADATRGALRFVAGVATLAPDGLAVQLDSGAERALAWRDVIRVVARRLPPDPPFEKTALLDLVTADGPVRLLPTTRVDYANLPGGAAPGVKQNWRRLIALAREHHPGLEIEAQSAAFFDGGQAPMFPALRRFAEYDAQYG
jgi:hypothetical protein